jgi:hypothetical protein
LEYYVEPPSPNKKRRYVVDECKVPAKFHLPLCPIHHPKRNLHGRDNTCKRREIPMETPIIDETGPLSHKIKELQIQFQEFSFQKSNIDERISYLCRELHSLIHKQAHYDTIGEVQPELNAFITDNVWIEKT